MKITYTVGALLSLVVASVIAAAQAPLTTFEVASVKASTASEPGARMNTRPGRVSAQNVTLRNLIVNAYQIRDNQVDTSSAPGWLGADRFDIEATMAAGTTPEQAAQMMQALLAQRFKLAIRRETRELSAYSLAPARSEGALGPALKAAADPQCGQAQPAAAPPTGAALCGSVTFAPGRLVGRSVSWTQIVNALSAVPAVGRLVVDGGDRAGLFDFELRWTPMNRAGGAGPGDAPDSVFTALQEQLGVKLTPVRAPVPVIVVTDAQRPQPE